MDGCNIFDESAQASDGGELDPSQAARQAVFIHNTWICSISPAMSK
jgi:hypothetical protein